MTGLRDLIHREPKRGIVLPAWIERLVSVGIVTKDAQVARRQRCVNVAAFATAGDALSHFFILAAYDFADLLVVNAYNLLVTIVSLFIPRLHRLGENTAALALIALILVGNTFVVWALGRSSNLHVYFTLAGAMLLLLGVHNWRLFLALFLLWVIALLSALNLAPVEGKVFAGDPALSDLLSSHAMINTIVINAAMLFYALATLNRAEVELQDEYERSEALVGAVMPATIAMRLKSGQEQRIADGIETLTVMFADLVGFSSAAHDLPPDRVVAFLDGLVRSFDALAEKHRIEKIKTIGDCYMAAAGFDGHAAQGARAMGHFALAMMDAIREQPPLAGDKLAMRIGIHCGEATAGIIGDTRFSYDVWGDAVNVASRLESRGVPGRIQVSKAYRELTRDVFVFEERGATELKGVGTVQTFFLLRARTS
jgi:adenylate cyclase